MCNVHADKYPAGAEMERGGAPLFGRYPRQKSWYLQRIVSFPNRKKTCNPGGVSSGSMAGVWEMEDFVTLHVWETRSFFVIRHERTAKTRSDLHFARVARVRLLEHVRHISTASVEEIAVVDAKQTPLPTADTQMNDRAFGWQACRNALLHGTREGTNSVCMDAPTPPTPPHACCT